MTFHQMTTTKQCPTCGNRHLAEMATLSVKHCVDCGAWIPWTLDPGQRPRHA